MIPAGTDVPFRITYLEMLENPRLSAPSLPAGIRLDHAKDAPAWYFLNLYRAVGRDWEWQDRLEQPMDQVARFAEDPGVEIWTAVAGGWTRGFYMLDFRELEACDLAYFGLVPEAVGSGLGTPLLQTAIATAWGRDITRMTVNTCTLDHPGALKLYQRMGFKPYRTEDHRRVLTRDCLAPHPDLT